MNVKKEIPESFVAHSNVSVKQEIKQEKDKSLDEMRLNNSKQLDENAKRIIELQR